ncbi:hypothetical protein ROZALSC1DRAFT_21908, partial [Rozella allomycis CSF55]
MWKECGTLTVYEIDKYLNEFKHYFDNLELVNTSKYGTVFQMKNDNTCIDKNGVSLVTQISVSRLLRIQKLSEHWPCNFIIVVHLVNPWDVPILFSYLSSTTLPVTWLVNLPNYNAINSKEYPINYLRNVGIRHVKTLHYLVIDADFLMDTQLYYKAKDLVINRKVDPSLKPRIDESFAEFNNRVEERHK